MLCTIYFMFYIFVFNSVKQNNNDKNREETLNNIIIHVSFHVCRYKSYSLNTEGRLGEKIKLPRKLN